MIEQVFRLTKQSERLTEKVIDDEQLHYMHMIFNKDEGLPPHFANAIYIYMTVLRGKLSLKLDDQDLKVYETGNVIKIPYNTRMEVGNKHDDPLEMTVIKAPAPKAPAKQG